jgi:hypothetical protein
MAGENTTTTLNGLHRVVYKEGGAVALVPENAILLRKYGASKSEKEGKYLAVAYDTGMEGGVTFGGTTGGATLEAAVAGQMAEAQVSPIEVTMRARITNLAAASASGGKTSYVKGVSKVYENAVKGMARKLEAGFLFGQSGIGVISGTPSTIHTSNKLITFTDASWSAGMFIGTKGHRLDAYNGASQINSNASLVIVAVDVSAKQIEVSGNATDLGNLADTHTLYWRGGYSNDQVGLYKQITSSSTVFGIDRSTYTDSLVGVTMSSVGVLGLAKILDGAAKVCDRGAEGELLFLTSFRGFSTLSSNEAALRRYNASKKGDNGFSSLEFYAPNGSKITVMAHPLMKEGVSMLFEEKAFSVPCAGNGIEDGDGATSETALWVPVADAAAQEMRLSFAGQCFLATPGRAAVFTGITFPS